MGIRIEDYVIKVNGKEYVPLDKAQQAIIETSEYKQAAEKLDEVNSELREAMKFMEEAVNDLKDI